MIYKTIHFTFLLAFVTMYSQNVNITDPAFKTHLINITPSSYEAKDLAGNYTKVDANGDGEIQLSEAENISELSPSGVTSIKDLAGIESFKNLIKLDARWMYGLEKLQLLSNPKLKNLSTNYSNKLITVDLKSCIALENLELFESQITEIDLTQNKNLKTIVISGKFTNLDFSNNSLLESLDLRAPNLTSLILSNCINLKTINFTNTQLVNYNFSDATNLEQINATNISLETLDFRQNNKLKSISINTAQNLKNLFLPTSSELKSLYLQGSNISSFDLSQNTYLENIGISNGNFEFIDVSKNPNLKSLEIFGCSNIETIDISNNINLSVLNAFNLPNLKKLYVKNGKTQSFGEGFMNCPQLNYVCCDDSEKDFFINKNIPTVVTDCLLSTSEKDLKNKIQFFPNPASSKIIFSQKIESVKIFSNEGKLVSAKKINSKEMDVSNLPSGNYFLQLKSGNITQTEKLMIK